MGPGYFALGTDYRGRINVTQYNEGRLFSCLLKPYYIERIGRKRLCGVYPTKEDKSFFV